MADNNRPAKPRHTPQYTDVNGKLQPQATELEEMVLGALMLEKDAYTTVCDLLVPDSFYDPRNQLIYEAIAQLAYGRIGIRSHYSWL